MMIAAQDSSLLCNELMWPCDVELELCVWPAWGMRGDWWGCMYVWVQAGGVNPTKCIIAYGFDLNLHMICLSCNVIFWLVARFFQHFVLRIAWLSRQGNPNLIRKNSIKCGTGIMYSLQKLNPTGVNCDTRRNGPLGKTIPNNWTFLWGQRG
jgi:hypothetical protein